MMRRLRSALVIAAAVVLAGSAACGVNGSVQTRSSTTASDRTSTTQLHRSGTRPEVTVKDHGTGTKTKLRLTLRKGARTNLSLKARTALTQLVSGRTQSVSVPPITEDLALHITEVKDGIATYEYKIIDAKLDGPGSLSPQQAQSIQSNLRQLVGLTSRGQIDDRGTTLSSEVHIPSSVPSSLRQTLQQLSDQLGNLSVPLPAEAVGEGATWSTDATIKLSGATVMVRNEYRLVSADGAVFTLDVAQHQTARPQPFNPPTLPLGAQARIVNWDITSTGTNQLKLGNILPEATLHASGQQTFTVSLSQSNRQSVTQRVTVDTKITDIGN